ncbi:hypothetical protein BT69DRAFT_1305500 [Atractiella rhizophila]|nr:hypothetical protein BT69DRAFT_1305500 [Atractiella rhizophila]
MAILKTVYMRLTASLELYISFPTIPFDAGRAWLTTEDEEEAYHNPNSANTTRPVALGGMRVIQATALSKGSDILMPLFDEPFLTLDELRTWHRTNKKEASHEGHCQNWIGRNHEMQTVSEAKKMLVDLSSLAGDLLSLCGASYSFYLGKYIRVWIGEDWRRPWQRQYLLEKLRHGYNYNDFHHSTIVQKLMEDDIGFMEDEQESVFIASTDGAAIHATRDSNMWVCVPGPNNPIGIQSFFLPFYKAMAKLSGRLRMWDGASQGWFV